MSENKKNDTGFGVGQFQRNRYFYGKLLSVLDFEDEQCYMNGKRHLLNRMINGFGIVCGLDAVKPFAEQGNIKIKFQTGGVAIDSMGKEIVIPVLEKDVLIEESSAPLTVSLMGDSTFYYLYLENEEQRGEPVKTALENSGTQESCSPSRIIEGFRVVASAQGPESLTISCPDTFDDDITVEGAKKQVRKWLREKTSNYCSESKEERVFFAAIKLVKQDEDSGAEPVVDPGETANHLSFVANNRVLSELLACHLSDFTNPHDVKMSQLEDFDANDNKIINLIAPTDANDAANKGYVDEKDIEIKGIIGTNKTEMTEYVDEKDTEIKGIIETNKTEMIEYVDEKDTEIKGIIETNKTEMIEYVDEKDIEIKGIIGTNKTEMTEYVDEKDTEIKGIIGTNKSEIIEYVDEKTEGKLINNGNDHKHSSGDGGQINHSDLNLNDGNNPHEVGMSHLRDLNAGGDINANNHKLVHLAEPEGEQDAATMKYVDSIDSGVRGYVDLQTAGKLVTNGDNHKHTSSGDGGQINHSDLNLDDASNPHKVGMSHLSDLDAGGDIDANNHKLVHLAEPEGEQDAATMKYVDAIDTGVRGYVDSQTAGKLVTNGDNHKHTSNGDGGQINHSDLNLDDTPNPHKAGMSHLIDLDAGKDINANNHKLVYLAEPEGEQDAATRGYVDANVHYVQGTAHFTGGASGYRLDTFINASGVDLKTGDVVCLAGTPVNEFRGDDDKIPLAEVTLANTDNASLVVGIVHRNALPNGNIPGTGTESGDPSTIATGKELLVVTHGCYGLCKVDKSRESIAVGDLLTPSAAGCAQKAVEPTIGSIIGKALGTFDPKSFSGGEGEDPYIPVFVNMQ